MARAEVARGREEEKELKERPQGEAGSEVEGQDGAKEGEAWVTVERVEAMEEKGQGGPYQGAMEGVRGVKGERVAAMEGASGRCDRQRVRCYGSPYRRRGSATASPMLRCS